MINPAIGTAFISSEIDSPKTAWESRMTVIGHSEKGIVFQKEHPCHTKDGVKGTVTLNEEGLEKSLWIQAPPQFQRILEIEKTIQEQEGQIKTARTLLVHLSEENKKLKQDSKN